MEKLTIAEAKRLNDTMVTEDHLKLHAANVAACIGAIKNGRSKIDAGLANSTKIGKRHDYIKSKKIRSRAGFESRYFRMAKTEIGNAI